MKDPKYYFSGTPCKFGNIAERRLSNRQCMCEQHQEQERAKALRWRNANVERARANFNKWRSENLDKNRADTLGRYYQNRAEWTERSNAWKAKNKERTLASVKKWAAENPHKRRAAQKRRYRSDPIKYMRIVENRRLAKMQRTPPWADLDRIEMVYRKAAQLSKETGTKMHVDHVVPLQGRKVSGLHTIENLQIIPASENCSKRHSFEV